MQSKWTYYDLALLRIKHEIMLLGLFKRRDNHVYERAYTRLFNSFLGGGLYMTCDHIPLQRA